MSEYYSNAENYEEELIYQEKSRMEKIFSMRTLKTILKSIMWVLVVIVYGMIFFRLCTGKPPKSVSGILWTPLQPYVLQTSPCIPWPSKKMRICSSDVKTCLLQKR